MAPTLTRFLGIVKALLAARPPAPTDSRSVDDRVTHLLPDSRLARYGEPTFYAGVERDNVAIHLQAASETKRQPGHGAINVFVTDVDPLYQELKARGARTTEEPADRPYGMRDFDIVDLDGNLLCFGESTSS